MDTSYEIITNIKDNKPDNIIKYFQILNHPNNKGLYTLKLYVLTKINKLGIGCFFNILDTKIFQVMPDELEIFIKKLKNHKNNKKLTVKHVFVSYSNINDVPPPDSNELCYLSSELL